MTAKDPVCGMPVQVAQAKHQLVYKGRTYYFCTPLCMVTFETDPEKYLAREKKR